MTTAKIWWGVVGICLLAFITISILSAQIFEHVPHSEDEVAYIFQAKVFAQNRLSVPTPLFEEAFWSPFVVDYQGQRFGKYPPGWPLLLSFGIRLGMPWAVNALLGIGTLVLITRLGQHFYGQKSQAISLIAAGLGLITPGFLFLSSSLLSHSASLFWNTLALIALFQMIRNPSSQNAISYAVLTGVSLGLAFITRPFSAVGIGLAVGMFSLALMIRGELKWTSLFGVILGGLPIAALLPLHWWSISGNPILNAYLLVWPYDRLGFGPDIGPYGYDLQAALFTNTRLRLEALATGLFGWPGWTSLIFIPIPFIARRANRWDWLLLATLLSLIFVHIFYWAFGGVDGGFPRYYYDALPALLLLTARGLEISFRFLRRWQLPFLVGDKTLHGGWLLIGTIVVFIGYSLVWNLPPHLAVQKGKYGITSAPLQRVAQANLTKPALIFVKDVEAWSDFAAPFSANSPTLDGPVVFAIDWNDGLSQQIRSHFSDRDCWELAGDELTRCEF